MLVLSAIGTLLTSESSAQDAPSNAAKAEQLDFQRDVRPILSNKCFRCHGPDKNTRQGGLRLDTREGALALRDGTPAIVPGSPEQSELIHRIEASDPEVRMPPPDSKLELSAQEKKLLRQWIQTGAEYSQHWSLIPPRVTSLPKIQHSSWPRNEIDYFIVARLEKSGFVPSPESSPASLLRRLSFDLTGLPPTLDQLNTFLADRNEDAYERAVDRLLASPHFGERMAVDWLDAARYADTNGYFSDKTRTAWLWRDWVIDAFNRGVPFDQFTIEQLAGDLLPPTTASQDIAQKVATGFNRNHMANNETGIIDEEYRVEYVADRLETTAATWLGLTIGCARCHDHKYDPLTQREFYQLFAFFNNGPEAGLISTDNPPPSIEVPSPEQADKLRELGEARAAAEQSFAPLRDELQQRLATWERTASDVLPASPHDPRRLHCDFEERITGKVVGTAIAYERGALGKAAKFDATQHVEVDSEWNPDGPWTLAVWLRSENSLGCILSRIEPAGDRRGVEVIWQKGRFQINLVHRWGASALEIVTADPLPGNAWQQLVISYDGTRRAAGLRVFLNGRSALVNLHRDALDGSLANAEPLRIARRDSGLGFYGQLDELQILQRSVTDREAESWYWSERLRGILAIPADQRSASDKSILFDYFVERHAPDAARQAHGQWSAAKQREADLRASIPTALVMQERVEPRQTFVLARGAYDHPLEAVQPGVPAALSAWPVEAPLNRLGLARWLVSPHHPLTARVTVNRFWQQCFGEGLVPTVNDFGTQGELPTHPELLDQLATQFVASGWDVKALLKRIVTSATYRQSSAATPAQLQFDADNRLLGRGPRFRLSAEMVRDQALASSGLLVARIGGPSVKPYQPPGLWEAVSYNGEETYVPDFGEGLWRRSLYTFWKRQSPPPALLTFDGPTRERCTMRRARTNTPLQALVLLNDVTYVEAARVLAALTLVQDVAEDERLRRAFRRVTSRPPEPSEIAVLRSLLQKQRARFAKHPTDARELLAVGASPLVNEHDPVELAAWTVTLQTLFNLDEAITRR